MAEPGFDAEEIGKLILKARSGEKTYNFAFGIGAKPEECGLLLDIRRPARALKVELKSSGAKVRKVCFGTFTVVGPEVLFAPLRPVKGMVRQLKKRFVQEGMAKFKPVLVGPDGQVIDEDTLPDEDLDDDFDEADEAPVTDAEAQEAGQTAVEDTPAAAPEPTIDDPRAADLRNRLAALRPGLASLPQDAAASLLAAFRAAIDVLARGDLDKAGALVSVLEARMAPGDAAQTGASAAAARLQAALTSLGDRIKALPAGPMRAALTEDLGQATATLRSGETEATVAAIRALQAALAQAAAQAPAGGARTVDPERLLALWQGARDIADKGVTALQGALRGHGVAELDRIADAGLNGVTEGNQTALLAAMVDLARATPDARPAAARRVGQASAAFRQFLAADPVISLCEANPFGVKVAIRATLTRALDAIDKAVAA